MSILTVTNMNHGFGDRAIFEDVCFRLLKGEHVGLVGANGEGKSTFMNIILGKVMPDEGKVEWSSRVRVGYLDQHASINNGQTIKQVLEGAFSYLFDLEKELLGIGDKMGTASTQELESLMKDMGNIQDVLDSSGFYTIDIKIQEVASGLGLKDLGLDKNSDDLSGGQRSKLLMAKLLLEKPDILLLDEPTNYLDELHIEWLKRYLQSYENAFILISHDIPFLNEVVNVIYHVENKKLTRYLGDYDNFQRIYEVNKKQLEIAYGRQQHEIARLETFVAKNKARASTTGLAKSRQKKLDKMDIIEISKEKIKPEFIFKSARASGKLIFETTDLVIGYDTALSKPLNLRMERGEKIALVGANGLGKTTLLKSLIGQLKPIDGVLELGDYQYIGYFEQEIKKANYNSCLEELWREFPGYTQSQIRGTLAKCGLTTKQIESKVLVLSGGEQAKLRLCKILNSDSNILILDEPTNHLDVDAKEELKRALKEYKGSILLVCHENEFYHDIVSSTWNCEDWTTKIV